MANKRKAFTISGVGLWYLVGLITTDGCLSSDGRHIDITSKDRQYLQALRGSLGIANEVTKKYNAKKQVSYHIQIGNKNFYEFLLAIGLTPNKSLSLGVLRIPGRYFLDFFRGLVDGDGCIRRWIHPANKREQWGLRVYSGSEDFARWLKSQIEKLLKVKGKIHRNGETVWVVKYGKMAAREIAKRCYYPGCFGLERKIKLAQNCISAYSGWKKSKTILN